MGHPVQEMSDQVWEVVGGVDKGGILVRQGKEVASAAEADRLSTGSLVKQLDLDNDRLQYELLTGTGPKVGWVSTSIKGKDLVIRTDKSPTIGPADGDLAFYDKDPDDEPPLDGESEANPGFVNRADDDPLREWFPLRQLTPAGVRTPLVCLGPPSVPAAEWTGPDAFGSVDGSEKTGNQLAQLARVNNYELMIAQAPTSIGAVTLDAWAAKLAPRFLAKLEAAPTQWMGIGVSVGCWLLVALLKALERLGNEGRQAVKSCAVMHMVGFPPPTAGLNFSRPEGMQETDWDFAKTISGPQKFQVPNKVAVYHLLADNAISKDRVFDWFSLEVQDGSTKSAYPFFGLQSDHSILNKPRPRTELYWSLTNNNLSFLNDGTELITQGQASLKDYQRAAVRLGHGEITNGLIDAETDLVVLAFDKDPKLKRIPNANLMLGKWIVQDNWTSGPTARSIGLDIRMWWDTSIEPPDGSKVGMRILCAVRFGNPPLINIRPGTTLGIHGGAIQSVMDEITAQCVRINAVPGCTTRQISHTISASVQAYVTYSCECVIENVKNDSCIFVSRGTLKDPLGKSVAISKADMVDLRRMAELQQMS